MRWLHDAGLLVGRVLDFGCGRGRDAAEFNLESYDPHWQPDMPTGKFDTITCIYVLNVVAPESMGDIIKRIKDRLVFGGKAYSSVRRDIKTDHKGRGCIQRNVELNMISRRKTARYQIYESPHSETV